MKSIIVIPARYKSSRFPGKPLLDLAGKSMIQRVYEQCSKGYPKDRIFVATEDERIVQHCEKRNMQVILTSDDCLTGTDRVAEVADKIDADIYINVQGDEPLFNPHDISIIEDAIDRYPGEIINGYCPIEHEDQYRSRTIPKVVFRPDGRLLYMSRGPIPGTKSDTFMESWRQICIYAFPKPALMKFKLAGKKTPLEAMEDIEILRFLEMGFDVRMIALSKDSIAIDTPEDVAKVMRHLV